MQSFARLNKIIIIRAIKGTQLPRKGAHSRAQLGCVVVQYHVHPAISRKSSACLQFAYRSPQIKILLVHQVFLVAPIVHLANSCSVRNVVQLANPTMATNIKNMKGINEQVEQWVQQDRQSIVELCSNLVRCKTPSPPGDTREAMTLVKNFLSSKGLAFKEVAADVTMPNLISTQHMSTEGKHLMLSGHLDVLPAGDEPG